MSDYKDLAKTVLQEHEKVLMDVKDGEVEKLLDAIAKAKCIQVFGMGRMKCAVRAFVMCNISTWMTVLGPILGSIYVSY